MVYGLPFLRHTLHPLMIMMFTFNLLGTAFFFAHYWVTPGSVGCGVDVFGIVFGYAGDYYSTVSVALLLFRSLVINRAAPVSSVWGLGSLALPIMVATGLAAATIGG
ncbi:hypothetical protein HDU93_004103, partial [Gonapodya sp. JEL0774]